MRVMRLRPRPPPSYVISVPPRSATFVDLFGPPMEQRGGANALGLALETGAVGELRVFEFLDVLEMAVDEWRVGERPEVFGWLQFGRIRRQEVQVDVVGH